ncbi:regulatory iron-sulfur-containing complex subunit RicT [Streptococcus macacae]|uniref:PSP1 C-terminal domain protein n=1 Tax=Streptococcus macacae NCTC 11558 TaxID=764298 RepID=G5JYE1_9STRE|nr:regulatory iron-sulfur-containing complex subunit RicT [Streptococcus macacae]EHJ51706.1 PSP1 C-terminal domain protein [Streptococcus macacae NCTC 11558]SUN78054.1 signal peptidase II [Streptococcus macacae NCTC 11558]
MIEVIGIKYKDLGNIQYLAADQNYQKGDVLVVQTGKGNYLAQVIQEKIAMSAEKLPSLQNMPKILRIASPSDSDRYQKNLLLAKESFAKVNHLIQKNQLDMRLIDIIFPLERHPVLITFVAEHRVDFRQLLRDLAGLFKARIELRQLNNREETKVYGGLGPCGRALCCSSFLGEFPPVSIKMAKNQNLSLHSDKTMGLCGRLMCCLSFEDDFYRISKEKFPDLGESVETANGYGTIAGIDVISETVKVHFDDKPSLLTYALEEVRVNG